MRSVEVVGVFDIVINCTTNINSLLFAQITFTMHKPCLLKKRRKKKLSIVRIVLVTNLFILQKTEL